MIRFHFDSQGFIVNDEGLQLTGYGVDANGNVLPAAPAPIPRAACRTQQ